MWYECGSCLFSFANVTFTALVTSIHDQCQCKKVIQAMRNMQSSFDIIIRCGNHLIQHTHNGKKSRSQGLTSATRTEINSDYLRYLILYPLGIRHLSFHDHRLVRDWTLWLQSRHMIFFLWRNLNFQNLLRYRITHGFMGRDVGNNNVN